MKKVLICDKISEESIILMKKAGLEVNEKIGLSKEKLIEEIPEYDAICIRSATQVDRDIIDASTKLKVIGRAGVGLDNIDLKAAKEKGITVLNTADAPAVSVAELTMGFILSVFRKIPQACSSVKEGKWEKKLFKGNEIRGKTLGLLGYGNIGIEVAKRALAFEMKVITYDILESALEKARKNDVGTVESMEKLLQSSDILSIHLPKTPATTKLISKKELEMIPEGGVVINIARGGIIDEDALYEFIKNGHIRGAALDVFEIEPVENHRLIDLPSVICTPHIGSSTVEAQKAVGISLAQKVIEVLK